MLTLTRSFASVTLLEGDSVIISCTPNIIEAVLFWSYNGTNLTRNTEGIMFTPTGLNHNLEIVNPSAGDSGLYACHSTIEDQPVNETIRVKVVAGNNNAYLLCPHTCTFISTCSYRCAWTQMSMYTQTNMIYVCLFDVAVLFSSLL